MHGSLAPFCLLLRPGWPVVRTLGSLWGAPQSEEPELSPQRAWEPELANKTGLWVWTFQARSSFQMTVALANGLDVTSRETLSGATP